MVDDNNIDIDQLIADNGTIIVDYCHRFIDLYYQEFSNA